MATQTDWTNNTISIVLGDLPSLSYDTAKEIVDAYLTSVGGWDGVDGAPANDDTPSDAATAIKTQQLSRTSTAEIDVPVTVKVEVAGHFADGTSDADKVAALQALVQSRVDALLSGYGADTVSYDWGNDTYTVRSGGALNQSQRQAVQTEVNAGGQLMDVAAIATERARSDHALDTLWVADEIYVTPDESFLGIVVNKYISTAYATQDGAATEKYVVTLNVTTSDVQTVTKVSI